MLARDVYVCESVLGGVPVLARLLDGEALRRALRGGELPSPDAYVLVTDAMLDAVAECGALVLKPAAGRR